MEALRSSSIRRWTTWSALLVVWAVGASSAVAADPSSRATFGRFSRSRPRIVVRAPMLGRDDRYGRLIVEPNVEVSGVSAASVPGTRHQLSNDIGAARLDGTPPPLFAPSSDPMAPPSTEPLFERIIDNEVVEELETEDCHNCSPWKRLFAFDVHKSSVDVGIGQERVMHAVFALDRTEPLNNFLIRYDTFRGMVTPDRAEYFWAKAGTGPALPETELDYQNLLFSLESGGDRFSMLTEIPIRMLDPSVNGNTSGLGDISLGPKVLLVKGKNWQLAHIFRTYLKTGSTLKGLGAGHVSLEPGILIRYKWTPRTYFHGELKFRFPVGADPAFSGQVLRYGVGAATVLYETDTFAILPTLEVIGWSVLDGQKTLPNGLVANVDGEAFVSLQPGVRFVLGPSGDFGLFEVGLSGAANLSNNGFFESLFRLDLRFSY